ncbi:MAG TPA: hypothetical protein VIB99_05860 [Candidatus Limnocylindrales bacterium]|jgi:hypothetical protein
MNPADLGFLFACERWAMKRVLAAADLDMIDDIEERAAPGRA